MTNELTIDAPEGVPWIDFTREFDAPVAAVFNAHRDPELVRQWLGPNGYEMTIDRWDFVTGGGYRYTHRNPDGMEFGFHGLFHTVRDDEFAIQTFEFEGAPDEVALGFMWFEDLGDGRCRLRPDFRSSWASRGDSDHVYAGQRLGRLSQLEMV